MRRWGVLLAVLGFVFAVPGVAFGYWLSSSPSATLRVSAGTVPLGQAPLATADGATVSVQVTPVGSGVDTYLLRRYGASGAIAAELRCADRCTETAVPDGDWAYTETPMVGSWSGAESGRSPVVVVDTTAPTPTVTSAAATADRTPTLIGRAGQARGDAGQVVVELRSGTRSLGQRTVPVRAGIWRLSVGPLAPQRSYTVLVRQSDAAGNQGHTSAGFVLDTLAPTVSLDPVRWPAFTGTAGAVAASPQASADSPTVYVQIFHLGRLVTTLTTTRADHRWSVSGASGSALASGNYAARAVQRDAAGNVSVSRSRTFSVDATAPVLTVSVPAYVNTAPIVTGRAGTAEGDAGTVVVAVATNGSVIQRLRVPVVAGAWRAVLRPLPTNRSYQLTVTQDDEAGNQGQASAGFVLDIVPPKPELTYAGGLLSGRAGTQAASASSSADEASVSLEVYAGPSLLTTQTVPVLNGTFSIAPPKLDPGTYQVVAVQHDVAGNVGRSRPVELTVPPAD